MGEPTDDASGGIGQVPKPSGRGRWGRGKLSVRSERELTGVLVVYWAITVIKNTSEAYEFASLATASLLIRSVLRWMHSKGLPEWAADEAYIARLRRWRHSQRTQS